jgi:putative flippase GtrA
MRELFKGIIVTLRNPRLGFRLTVMRQFVKFCMVGVLNTLISFGLYAMLTRYALLDPLVANAIAFVAAVTVSFILNKMWTFGDLTATNLRQYYRFFAVSGIGLIISEFIILTLHKMFHIFDITAFIISVVVVMFWNFGANKSWTFSEK